MTIEQIHSHLTQEGYKIKFHTESDLFEITSGNIRGFVSYTEGDNRSRYITTQFAIDHVDCFDKVSKCPILLPVPTNGEELDHLVAEMKKLGTKKGYAYSNDYGKPITNYFEALPI